MKSLGVISSTGVILDEAGVEWQEVHAHGPRLAVMAAAPFRRPLTGARITAA